MAFDISNFKSNLIKGGARPSLFEVDLTFPDVSFVGSPDVAGTSGVSNSGVVSQSMRFLAKASALPTSTVAPIEVPYFGRKVKFAGNRTFPEWTITIINDENFLIRKAFEAWLAAINTHRSNEQVLTNQSYMKNGYVTQYGKDGKTLRAYGFEKVFPSEISPIELSWASENEIEEFTVTLQYDWWYAIP
jgi:T4-like virus tail tube protein gp19